MTAFFSPASIMAAAASVLVGSAGLTVANAAPGAGTAVVNQAPSNLVKVHDDGYRRRHRHYHRRYYRGHVVDAPFAHVESGRHTVVDAPFVHVYSGRHGNHIVAPFVDLWEPR
jgi:hypothetical protein